MADKKISQLPASTTPLGGTEELAVVQSGDTKKVSIANLTAGRTVEGTSFALDSASSVFPTAFGGLVHFNVNDITYVVAKPTGGGLILNNGSGSSAMRLLNPSGSGYIEFNTGAAGGVTSSINTVGSFAPPAGAGIDFSADGQAAGMTSELLDDYEEGTWTPTLTAGYTGLTYGATTKGEYIKVGGKVTLWFYLIFSGTSAAEAIKIGNFPFTVKNNVAYSGGGFLTFCNVSNTQTNSQLGVFPINNATEALLYSINVTAPNTAISIANITNKVFVGCVTYQVA